MTAGLLDDLAPRFMKLPYPYTSTKSIFVCLHPTVTGSHIKLAEALVLSTKSPSMTTSSGKPWEAAQEREQHQVLG